MGKEEDEAMRMRQLQLLWGSSGVRDFMMAPTSASHLNESPQLLLGVLHLPFKGRDTDQSV